MKLSNKILIGFFGGTLVYMIMAFTEVRLKGDYNRLDGSNAKIETRELAGLQRVVLNNLNKRVNIRASDSPHLELRSFVGDQLPKLEYTFQDGILTINRSNFSGDEHIDLYIYVSEAVFTQLEVVESRVNISNLKQPVLNIHQTGGHVALQGRTMLGRLNITATEDAELDLYDKEVDTVYLKLDNSNVELQTSVKRLEALLSNNSRLSSIGANDIVLKRDEDSRLYLTN